MWEAQWRGTTSTLEGCTVPPLVGSIKSGWLRRKENKSVPYHSIFLSPNVQVCPCCFIVVGCGLCHKHYKICGNKCPMGKFSADAVQYLDTQQLNFKYQRKEMVQGRKTVSWAFTQVKNNTFQDLC